VSTCSTSSCNVERRHTNADENIEALIRLLHIKCVRGGMSWEKRLFWWF
jgi:hypothetical protein